MAILREVIVGRYRLIYEVTDIVNIIAIIALRPCEIRIVGRTEPDSGP